MVTLNQKLMQLSLLLLAFYLRLSHFFSPQLDGDEALFATWAREIAIWRDPLLRYGPDVVDKPPLLFYAQALFYPLFGPVTWAARMPNLIAGLLLIPVVGLLAQKLTQNRQANLIGMLCVAFSPLAVRFSQSGYTDMLLTFWVTLALLAAVNRDPKWGLWLGLGLLTKYQAILFLPAILTLLLLDKLSQNSSALFSRLDQFPKLVQSPRERLWLITRPDLWQGVLLFLLFGLALAIWDLANGGGVDLASTQISGFGGLRVIRSWEIWPRMGAISPLLLTILGPGLTVLALFALIYNWGQSLVSVGSILEKTGHPVFLRYFFVFVIAYIAFHWLWAILPAPRYYLPLLPLVAVAVGGLFSSLFEAPLTRVSLIILLGAIGLNQPYTLRHSDDQGAAKIAAYFDDAPYGTVLYDHWYSWQWRYHLFDKKVFVSWFPHPAALAEDVSVFYAENPGEFFRYVALPVDERQFIPQRFLNEAGFELQLIRIEDKIALYAIQPTEP